jgi:hypothetical protein
MNNVHNAFQQSDILLNGIQQNNILLYNTADKHSVQWHLTEWHFT